MGAIKNSYILYLFGVKCHLNREVTAKDIQAFGPDLLILASGSQPMLPEVDGIELCKKLKESNDTNHIPIILLTAKSGDQSKVEAYKIGVDGYITKPFTSQLLLVSGKKNWM